MPLTEGTPFKEGGFSLLSFAFSFVHARACVCACVYVCVRARTTFACKGSRLAFEPETKSGGGWKGGGKEGGFPSPFFSPCPLFYPFICSPFDVVLHAKCLHANEGSGIPFPSPLLSYPFLRRYTRGLPFTRTQDTVSARLWPDRRGTHIAPTLCSLRALHVVRAPTIQPPPQLSPLHRRRRLRARCTRLRGSSDGP